MQRTEITKQKKGMEIWHDYSISGDSYPLVISYFTDLFYLREAFELTRTLQQFGLAFRVEQVLNLHTWIRNTNHKPSHLLYIHRIYPERDILWLDADARVRELPLLLQRGVIQAPIAFHKWQGRKPLSGTVYLPAGEERYKLLEKWIQEVNKDSQATDQVCMGRAVRALNITPYLLPEEYCWIYDLSLKGKIVPSPLDKKPVIEHLQASRYTKEPFK